ncbi:MAG: DUF3987 domain-containing protein [Thermodesulfobacteriota bacterium]|nr:DUF3987 domain-containing protein [Thermodesulfobacteriota bacterium]
MKFHDAIETELNPYGEFFDVKDYAAKIADNVVRIAANFHVFDNGPEGEISEQTISRAAKVGLYYLREARRIMSLLDKPQEISDAEVLLAWLIQHDQDQCPLGTILQYGPNQLRTKNRRDIAIKILEENHWVMTSTDGRKRSIVLNPKARGTFNELS